MLALSCQNLNFVGLRMKLLRLTLYWMDKRKDKPNEISGFPNIGDEHLHDSTVHLEVVSARSIITYWNATYNKQQRRENRSWNGATPKTFGNYPVTFDD